MIKNERNEFTFTEFLRVYFEAEKFLIQRIEETSNKMLQLSQERDEIQKKYDYAFHTEKPNYDGASSENNLKINFERILSKGSNHSLFSGKQIYISISMDGENEIAKTPPFYVDSFENYIQNSIFL